APCCAGRMSKVARSGVSCSRESTLLELVPLLFDTTRPVPRIAPSPTRRVDAVALEHAHPQIRSREWSCLYLAADRALTRTGARRRRCSERGKSVVTAIPVPPVIGIGVAPAARGDHRRALARLERDT